MKAMLFPYAFCAFFLSGIANDAAAKATVASSDRNRVPVAMATGRLLDGSHFLGQKFDDAVSTKFFENYLKAVDPSHLHFLQSDIDEFSVYRLKLDELTLLRGDTSPAYKIYAKLIERQTQRVTFVKDALARGQFDFKSKETWKTDRDKEPWPMSLAEARVLWDMALRHEYLQEKLAGKGADEIIRTLQRRYDRMLRMANEVSGDDIFEVYLNALAHAYDPHTDFMGAAQMEDFAIQMNLKVCGVGATLESDDGFCRISALVSGGPAARSGGLQAGDRIVAVQQGKGEPVDIVDMPLHKAIDLIRGPKGSRVKLTVIPANATSDSVRKTVVLVRDEIKLEEQEAKAYIADMPWEGRQVRIGVIDLPVFYADMDDDRRGAPRKSATEDVARLLVKLNEQRIEGLVLDLRNNGGGSLDEAIGITGLFIPSGPVVQTKDADGRIQVDSDEDGQVLYSGPLVVLTDRTSASASEIVAGALQDHGRAVVVGDPSTFGKGTVQSIIPLGEIMKRTGLVTKSNPGSLKMTVAKFYRPSGASTQLRGVTPDITLPSPTDVPDIAEMRMDNAIAWDAVEPSNFESLDLVDPYLSALRARSESRVSSDLEFAWLKEDSVISQEKSMDSSVSLNEAERMVEREAAERQMDERERLSAKLSAPDETVYAISLELSKKRGLPTPQSRVKKEMTRVSSSTSKEKEGYAADTDPVLMETKRILADYIGLVRQPATQEIAKAQKARPRLGLDGS